MNHAIRGLWGLTESVISTGSRLGRDDNGENKTDWCLAHCKIYKDYLNRTNIEKLAINLLQQ